MNPRTKKCNGVHRLLLDQDGVTSTEYGVILGLIVVMIIAAVGLFGSEVSSTTAAVHSGLSNTTDFAGPSFSPGSFRSQANVTVP